jgi:hypothetical protein
VSCCPCDCPRDIRLADWSTSGTDEWALLPSLLHLDPLPLLDGDQRVDLLVVVLEHLTEAVIVFYMLLHRLLRDRALDTQKVLEDLEVLTVNFLKLCLPIVVLSDGQVVSNGGRRIVHDHSVIQRAVG